MALRRRRFFLALLIGWVGIQVACREAPAGTPTTAPEQATATPAGAGETITAQPSATATLAPTAEPTAQPTATPEPPPKTLTVCMAAEPADLYLYGTHMLVQQAVFHGLYENLITSLGYDYQAQGLEKLPSLADGDAKFDTVLVKSGDRVVNASGDLVLLGEGVVVRSHSGDLVEFDGEPLVMDQMVVDFTLKPLVWEDGVPVTAADSVFSYEIAADPESRVADARLAYTADYRALDELTVRWTGLPGRVDSEFFLNIWQPLPRYVLGDYTAPELAGLEAALRTPLANGPFRLQEWVPGDHLTLVRNEQYYRAAEGLPYLDSVVFRFLAEPGPILEGILAGRCDVAYQDGVDVAQLPALLTEAETGSLLVYAQTTPIFEHIDFGIEPVAEYAETRPDWFGDGRVRQAVAQCTDRQAMVDTLLYGQGAVLHAYVPDTHPLYPAGADEWPYDPAAANLLLVDAGYVDTDGDGIREDPAGGAPFRVTLATTEGNVLRGQVAELFRQNLAQCGIDVEVLLLPAEVLLAPGPEGPIFGRQFDLALFAWLMHANPACETYESRQIPGEGAAFPAGWTGNNNTGWRNEAYDEACDAALAAAPGMAAYASGHEAALRLFMNELPSLPLFPRLKVSLTRPGVLNFRPDSTEPSELWNLFELDLAPGE